MSSVDSAKKKGVVLTVPWSDFVGETRIGVCLLDLPNKAHEKA